MIHTDANIPNSGKIRDVKPARRGCSYVGNKSDEMHSPVRDEPIAAEMIINTISIDSKEIVNRLAFSQGFIFFPILTSSS